MFIGLVHIWADFTPFSSSLSYKMVGCLSFSLGIQTFIDINWPNPGVCVFVQNSHKWALNAITKQPLYGK